MELCVLAGPLSFQFSFCIRRRGCGHGQSGCGEILEKVIKVDYWDIHAMADAIYSICTNEELYNYLREEGLREVDNITWEKVGVRIRKYYDQLINR